MSVYHPPGFSRGVVENRVLRNTTRVTRNTHTHTTLSEIDGVGRKKEKKSLATADRNGLDSVYATVLDKPIGGCR